MMRMLLEGRTYDKLPVSRFLYPITTRKWLSMAKVMLLENVFLFLWTFTIIGALLWNRFTPESLHVSQDIQPLGYVGCACILVAIVLSQLNFRSRAKTVAHSSTVHHAGK